MKKISILLCFLVMLTSSISGKATDKSRVIVMTDLGGYDPDDTQSLIHLLVTSDRIDIEGIISTQAWLDDPERTDSIKRVIDKYAEIYPNLAHHSAGFPTPARLDSIIVRGQSKAHMSGVGKQMDSEGSELILRTVSNPSDNRPVWIIAWGGMNTLAQALWKASQFSGHEEFIRIKNKIRVYDILGQDDAGAWIAANFPDIIYIRNKDVYGWAPDDNWISRHIQSVNPFGTIYPDRRWATEGDSPSFMYLLSNGLNVPERPDFGGWGGRFSLKKTKNIPGMDFIMQSGKDEMAYGDYLMFGSSQEGVDAINRWKQEIYNDFAVRIIWSATDCYSDANHHPKTNVNGHKDNSPLYMKVKAGDSIRLDASSSTDPDKDKISFRWQVYDEPGTYRGSVTLNGADSPKCTVNIPRSTHDKGNIHIVLTITDSGMPALSDYCRVILNVQP